MPRECSVCISADREEIEKQLVSSVPLRDIEGRFEDVSRSALHRHRRDHLSQAIVAVAHEMDVDRARSVFERLSELEERCRRLLDAAEADNNVHQALGAVRELRQLLELLAKITGELREGPAITVNLASSAEWLALRDAIFGALSEHPAARLAVARRLEALESGGGS